MLKTKSFRNNRINYTILLLLCVIGFWLFENFYTPNIYSENVDTENRTILPELFQPSSTTGDIVKHEHFTLSYNEPFEQAEWVAYMLKKEHLTYDDRKRPYFIEDPKVKTKSADWRNYKGSGYDRGHLCPAGDRRFSKQAYNETFYTSNISPQNREFNAGVWNQLEMQIRRWVKKNGTHFVITGGVLQKGLDEIGDEDVDVPKFYYKIIAKGNADNLTMIGFLMPNKPSSKPIEDFVVSIDNIEALTGVDFFQDLPDTQERTLENIINLKAWKF